MLVALAFLLLIGLLLILADLFLGRLVWQFFGEGGPPPRGLLIRLILQRRTLSITASAVSHLATITRLNLPLSPALLAASHGERGRLRQVLMDLSQWLGEGAMLSVALRQSIPGCPAFVESVTRAGEESGQLPRALATLETMLGDRLRYRRRITQGYWVYPLVLLLGMMGIVTGVVIKVVPKFQEIFLDFDTVLPESTQALIRVSALFVQAPLLACLWPMILLAAGALLILFAWPRRVGPPRLPSWITDTICWYVPVVHDIEQAWGTAASVEVLGMGLAAGLPLELAARSAGEIDVNVYIRRRFQWFAESVARGEPPGAAARRAGLGRVVAGAIASLLRGCEPDVALGHAAQYHRAMAYRWWHMLAQVVWPAITVVCATVVAFIALALFEPLVALIDSVTGLTGVM